MGEIPAKIYYDVITGEVLTLIITPESVYIIEETTKEEDISVYPQLQGKSVNDVDYIRFEYGELTSIIAKSKSYKVNLETKQLEVIYYTEDELNAVQKQIQEDQALSSRVSDISTYLSNADGSTISNVEDTILGVESNKVSEENGGM
ncbi:hypothetical protein [uncultured Clostridium sp.]|uniref:hypothetical protein n=1 Tax=uncultured Clostridium sp. TaxID=59620 RepID=UPI0028E8B82A|nr:hypothetical protein [uncultured Clostridium sp.]